MTPTELQETQAFNLMQQNAFLFYELRETIRQDMRLYNAPVYITIPFTKDYPILGQFIRWWEESQVANFIKDNRRWLVYDFVGSPMTGSSYYNAVCEDGHHKAFSGGNFGALMGSFRNANEKESNTLHIQSPEQTFTLEQVVSTLQTQYPLIQYKIRSEYQTKLISELTAQSNDWERKYYQLLFKPHKEALMAMHKRYSQLIGEIDETTMDAKQKKTLRYYAETCLFDTLHHCYPDMIIKRADARKLIQPIEKYLIVKPCTHQDADI